MEKRTRKCVGHLSVAQKKKLLELVSDRPDLRSGKFSKDFSLKDAQQEWENIAIILNAIPGSNKDWRLWRKTWQDLQSKAKAKKAEQNKSLRKTGGGPAPEPISDFDNGVLALINNNSVVGHEGVSESLVVEEDVVELEPIEVHVTLPLQLPPPIENQDIAEIEDGANEYEVPVILPPPDFENQENQAIEQGANQATGANESGRQKRAAKKINMKTLLKEKLELKRILVESTIKFQSEYIRLQEDRNKILKDLVTKFSVE